MASDKRYRKRGFGAAEVEHKATKVTKSSVSIVGQFANYPMVGAGTQGSADVWTYCHLSICPHGGCVGKSARGKV